MDHNDIFRKARGGEDIDAREALWLWESVPPADLFRFADELRYRAVDDPQVVTWQIDRNVNITNVCISGCKFCNFHCKPHQKEKSYITTIEEYCRKIEEAFALGGDQLLIQGGLHPELGIEFYEGLFRELKLRYPELRLNALGAPEVSHIARLGGLTARQVLERLRAAGLDSLPGAGAEILCDDVRRHISPGKPSAGEWFEVMRTAHEMNIPATATMMYGHVETTAHRIEHLIKLRELQAARPAGYYGFTAFIPWVFCAEGTELAKERVSPCFSPVEYLKVIAISRIILNNIRNIQASWLTVGREIAQIALHCGANDFGSIMIEENVVSAAGAGNRFDSSSIRQAIREAGFIPRLRDQLYRERTIKQA